MNRFIKKDYLDEIQSYVEELETVKNPKHTQPQDATIKWGYILKNIDDLGIKPKRILDLGCGQSHLPAILANRPYVEEVVALDRKKINKACENHPKVTCVLDDARHYLQSVKSKSFDLIYDACAVVHFYPKQKRKSEAKEDKHNFIKNVGLKYISSKMTKLIKPGSFFISTSDVFTPMDVYPEQQFNVPNSRGKIKKHDMLYVEQILEIIKSGGLKLYSPFDYNTDDIFTQLHKIGVHSQNYRHHLSIINLVYKIK